ncbi:tape measure protein [Arthrobacter woluwensis]|uniref:Tape measure domain-containing protein n=1 Tax=Arthrobacter woluwensis TaxID=156980 RepID=A0A1H4I4U7_9MICC|nr:tape measure protein [Arthrobacter woluwensis]SEB28806.1 tape measure domain-containing protein [Arthrobacter woluwensis]
MSELATAYVNIVASSKGLGKSIVNDLTGAADAGSAAAGKRGGSSFGAAFAGIAGKVLAVAGPAMVAGLAVKGGISRALNIEDAQAKLTGLGHSTQSVTKIMNNAMAAVKGTAFGMGDAATVAAGVVAAGVKPGQDLERTLKLVGDSATIAGVGMGEMGAIFNKVAASNKIQGDVIAQLNDAGIPIVQLLGKELGKTSDEVYDLASKGKIDFATFQNAMEKGLGGAALKSGETFRGSMANLKAALGRVGETVMLPFLAAMKDGANGLIPVIDGLNKKLKPIFQDIGKGYQEMKKSFDDGEAPKFANPILTTFAAVGAAAGKASREVKGGIKAMKAAYEDGGSDVTSSGFAGVLERIGISLRAGKDGVDAFFKAFQTGTQDFSKSGFAGFMSDFGSKIKGSLTRLGIHSGR